MRGRERGAKKVIERREIALLFLLVLRLEFRALPKLGRPSTTSLPAFLL
jgi:hypothetical protein